ncbi:hypothetical protein F0223_23720 [Vibrio coralliilyticus]|uniref:hypothetical protein n=1 Tax=Vibrio TaxID=662 RepID=UPI0005042A6F|nr:MULTISPECIES: hypothetical protein [Vibrio]KFI12037.1 hypothetical protein IX95_10325 [Vibrio sp. B183]NOI21211.1 hypothetical protein [Vibrio coralliilyticus]
MKKTLFALSASTLLLGCSSISDLNAGSEAKIVNKVEIGTKEGASSVIVLNYHRAHSEPQYQHYDVYLYISKLPEQSDFTVCEFESSICNSAYSVWQNILRDDQNGVWFSSELKFPMHFSPDQDVPSVQIKTVATQSFLEWDKTEDLYKQSQYVSGQLTKQGSLSATAHKLR